MNAAQTRIAHQSLVTRRAKDSEAARHVQPQIHDAPGAFDRAVFRRKDFRGPLRAVIDAIGPVLGD